MEGPPIQNLTTNTRAAVEEIEGIAVDDLDGQQLGKGSRIKRLAGIAHPDICFQTALDTQRLDLTGAKGICLSKYQGLRFTFLDKMAKLAATKRACQTQKVDRFKHTGFAAAIVTIQNVDSAEPVCSDIGQIAYVLDTELLEGHQCRYRRGHNGPR